MPVNVLSLLQVPLYVSWSVVYTRVRKQSPANDTLAPSISSYFDHTPPVEDGNDLMRFPGVG